MSFSVNCRLVQYANDSILVASGKDPTAICEFLSSELKICDQWLVENNLSLHMGKTEFIMFGSKRKIEKLNNLTITHRDVTIKATTMVTYLGLQLDQNSFGSQIVHNIISKGNSRLKFLYRQSDYLNKQAKNKPHFALP